MQHVSVDLAKRLNLPRIFEEGDWFYNPSRAFGSEGTIRVWRGYPGERRKQRDTDLWLPALSDLLEEAKKRWHGVRIDTADSWVELVDPETGGVIVHIDQEEGQGVDEGLALALLKAMEVTNG